MSWCKWEKREWQHWPFVMALCKLSVETCVFFGLLINYPTGSTKYGYTKVHSLIQTPILFLKQGEGAQSCTHKNGKLAPFVSTFNRLLKDQHNQLIKNARCDPVWTDDRRPVARCTENSRTPLEKKRSFQYIMTISADRCFHSFTCVSVSKSVASRLVSFLCHITPTTRSFCVHLQPLSWLQLLNIHV